jgi:hypothetical protein
MQYYTLFILKLGWETKNPHILPTTFVVKTRKMQKRRAKVVGKI